MMVFSDVKLRRLGIEDIDRALAVESSVYAQPWTRQIFLDELAQPNRTYLAAIAADSLAGYGGVMVVGDEAHITTVVVAGDHRGHRIGTRLMLALTEAAIAAEARSLTLEVRVSNEAAQALYRRFGMAPVGVRKNYYRTEDALIMWAHDIHLSEYAERLTGILTGIELDGPKADS